jgi:N-acetylmuramoyl-L-alanine amidase
MRLAIDAGHGMSNARSGVFDPGAVSAGHQEADIALAFADSLAWYCHINNVAFALSRRTNGESAPLRERSGKFEKAKCTHLISFHCNASASQKATGTETLYADDPEWARTVQVAALEALGLRDRGIKHESTTRHGRLAILRMKGKCALLELAFITNPDDRKVLLARASRVKFCEALIKVIKEGKA